MHRRSRAGCVLILGLLSVYPIEHLSGQVAENKDTPADHVVLTKLSPPIYLPVARQARIEGEIELTLGIRPDGTVGSVDVVSGHPLLRQVAIESARRSQFECLGCTARLTSYSVRYKFELLPLDQTKDCADEERNGSPPLKVDSSQHDVTVFGKVMETCDPAVKLRKVRSAKCFYLWRCGRREVTSLR
ncbi:MAG: energy transducer TonB [Candidatus Sulfotelmatobacter sp.]